MTGLSGARLPWNSEEKLIYSAINVCPMGLNKDDFNRLEPEARIKKLRKIEESSKSDLKEAGELIKRAKAEISTKLPEGIRVPEPVRVDITTIFDEIPGLEATVRMEAFSAEEQIRYISAEMQTVIEQHYGATDSFVKHVFQVKLDDLNKYENEADKVSDGAASRSVLKSIKKYSLG